MTKYLLILLSLILFLPNLFHHDINPVLAYNNIERFNPNLIYLNSLVKTEKYIDSIAATRSVATGSLDYMEIAASVIRDRFYHGFSHFALDENWIAALGGKFLWYDLSCKVQPEEILKHSYAACSQQEIVLMAILHDKHIPYRSVLFPHHYALEVWLNNKWYYFDTNMEPNISGEERWAEHWHNSADSLKRYYNHIEFKDLDYKLGVNYKLQYGPVNEIPALHERLFASFTSILSKIAWLFPLLLLFYLERKHTSSTKESSPN
jgi:hypothetical protein